MSILGRKALHPAAAPHSFAAFELVLAACLLALIPTGCAQGGAKGAQVDRFGAPGPHEPPGICAWYGDSDGRILYFGESAFWASMKGAGGDPTADLAFAGKKHIGRFDLVGGRMQPPLALDVGGGSGIWDVLAAPGRVWFTTFFGPAGSVDLVSGEVKAFDGLGTGLNELAPGPEGSLLASRYGAAGGGPGSVVLLTPSGERLAEYPLAAAADRIAAPKTVAWDPLRHEIWVTVDLVSPTGEPATTDARRLDADGHEIERIELPEIQFVVFAADGTGYLAASDGTRLELLVLEPGSTGAPLEAARRILLDRAFAGDLDFVQDIHPASDGRVVLTRWSGRIHVVRPGDRHVETVDLPRESGKGLYYSAVLAGKRLCATYCAGIEVVCTELP